MSRMNKMKVTPVGSIPEDWKTVQLGAKASVLRGGSPRPIDYFLTNDPDGINWIKIGDVSVGAKYIKRTEEKIISEGAARSRKVFSGDFLLSNSMSFGRPYILQIDGCIHDGWLVIQDYYKTFDTDYLYYALNATYIIEQYKSMAAGSSVLNLNKDIVKKVNIAVPSPDEQKKIAYALSSIDNMIEVLDEAITKKRQIKKGLIQQLLTGKVRLPGFHSEWIPKNLGKSATIKARIGWQGLTTKEYLNSGEYYLITGTDFKDGRIDWKNCHFVTKDRFEQDPYIKIREHDVLISKDGTIGKVAYLDTIPGPGTLNSGVFVVRSKDKDISQRYLAKVFISKYFDDFIDSIVAGSTIVHLYQKDIVKFDFMIPPSIEEQNQICDFIEGVDNEILNLESKRDKYASIKQGMMQELLTGKTRLI